MHQPASAPASETTSPPASARAIAALAREVSLGPRSAQMLVAAGITSIEQIRALGSVTSFLRVKQSGQPASLNLLWALEGAATGLRWQVVAREHRASLLLALDQMQGECTLSPP